MCRGAYTREDVESEEMCVLQTLAWYLNPPTASHIANHVLSLVSPVAGAVIDCASASWASFVGRVYDLIDASLVDIGLSVLRPSTVALASMLISIPAICDPCERQAVLRATRQARSIPSERIFLSLPETVDRLITRRPFQPT